VVDAAGAGEVTVVVLPVGLTYVVDEAGVAVVTVAGAGFWTVRSFLYSHAAVAATSTNAKMKRCMTFSLPTERLRATRRQIGRFRPYCRSTNLTLAPKKRPLVAAFSS
jgi:hypothetical protein